MKHLSLSPSMPLVIELLVLHSTNSPLQAPANYKEISNSSLSLGIDIKREGRMEESASVIQFSIPDFLSLAPLSVPIRHFVDSCLKWQERTWYFGMESWLWTKVCTAPKLSQLQLMWQFAPRMNVTFDKWILLDFLLSTKTCTPNPSYVKHRQVYFLGSWAY